MTSPPHLTILFDNRPGLPGLSRLWGFAAIIQAAERTILFDTGSNGRALLRNMDMLGVVPESIDLVVLSHAHWDHMGGLDSILEVNSAVTLVVHEGFSKHLLHDLTGLCKELVVVGVGPRQLAPGIFTTGMFDSQPSEQALVLDSGGVTAVVSGCAHPGMEWIVEYAGRFLGKRVNWAVGGFHLMNTDIDGIAEAVRALQALHVDFVVPTHCTGEKAEAAFKRAFGTRCVQGGVGREIRMKHRPGARHTPV